MTSRAILTAKEYQKRVTERLQEIFAKEDMVREEWAVSLDAADGFADPRRYAPRLDIAVGPFNISHDIDQNVAEINSVARDHWLIAHIQDGKTLTRPDNPRCLLAIEIEFSGSSKHVLGDFTNASMMGLIGVVVGTPENMERICRVRQYITWLQSVGKAPTSLFGNIVVFDAHDFLRRLTR